jgi:hypothetical protein
VLCGHCGKEYSDEYSYCPFCAEPKPKPKPTIDEQYIQKEGGKGVLLGIIATLVLEFVGLITCFAGGFIIMFPLMIFVFPGMIPLAWHGFTRQAKITVKKNDRKSLILKQFTVDKTSICPVCGSHSISLGRKGYDWNKGFWYSIFDVPGGRYLAGMDGRRVICYCDNCDHRWESDKVWIK